MSTPTPFLHALLALFLASGFALTLGLGPLQRHPAGRHGDPASHSSIQKAGEVDEWDSDVVKVRHNAPNSSDGTGSGS